MAVSSYSQFQIPNLDMVVTDDKMVSEPWHRFFIKLFDLLNPLGAEKSFALANNQASATSITGLQFDSSKINHAVIEYLIQRITSTTEIISAGIVHVVYKPTAGTWHLVPVGTPGPDASGVTFSITTSGQIQYTSSNVAGSPDVSKITFRARTLGARVAP